MFLTLGISYERLLQNFSAQSFLLNLFETEVTLPLASWYVGQKSPPLFFPPLKRKINHSGIWTLLMLVVLTGLKAFLCSLTEHRQWELYVAAEYLIPFLILFRYNCLNLESHFSFPEIYYAHKQSLINEGTHLALLLFFQTDKLLLITEILTRS